MDRVIGKKAGRILFVLSAAGLASMLLVCGLFRSAAAMSTILSVFLRAFPRNENFDSWVLSDWEFFGFLNLDFPRASSEGAKRGNLGSF